jgi:hypothetical protein
VGRSIDLALEKERLDELLEAADEEHLTVEPRVQLEVVEKARRASVADAAHEASRSAR